MIRLRKTAFLLLLTFCFCLNTLIFFSAREMMSASAFDAFLNQAESKNADDRGGESCSDEEERTAMTNLPHIDFKEFVLASLEGKHDFDALPRVDCYGRKLREYVLYDTQAQLPMLRALMPENWGSQNATVWNLSAELPVEENYVFSAPGGEEVFGALNSAAEWKISYYAFNNQNYGYGGYHDSTMNEQGIPDELKALFQPDHPIQVDEFLSSWIPSLFRIQADQELELEDREIVAYDLPGISSENMPQGDFYSSSECQNHFALGTYRLREKDGREYHLIIVISFSFAQYLYQDAYATMENYQSNPTLFLYYQVPYGDCTAERAQQEMLGLMSGVDRFPGWTAMRDQFFLEAARVKADQYRKLQDSLRESNEYLQRSRQEVLDQTYKSQEKMLQGWTDILTSTSRAVNPHTGEEITFSNQYKHTWIGENNQVFQTDDFTDPNTLGLYNSSGTWQEVFPDY